MSIVRSQQFFLVSRKDTIYLGQHGQLILDPFNEETSNIADRKLKIKLMRKKQ